jgi:hypothetical protein
MRPAKTLTICEIEWLPAVLKFLDVVSKHTPLDASAARPFTSTTRAR